MNSRYVALGDSMSIDDYAGGPGRGAASLLHRDLDGAVGRWSLQLLARDGAVTADVLDRQLPRIDGVPDLVTITMGGNDLLAAYGDDTAAAAIAGRVAAQGEGVLSRLRGLAGADCRIVVTTVYDPSDGTGVVAGSGLAPWPGGPHWIRTLNQVLTDLAARHGAAVADVHTAFLGHGVTAGDPARSDPEPAGRDLWLCAVVEPNAWGAQQIRTTWWNQLATAVSPAAAPR